MDELKIIKGLEMFTASQAHEGAAYLHETYCKMDEGEKKEFINWMWHESENYKRTCLLSDPISKKTSQQIENSVKNSMRYFLQEITYTSEDIREWLKQAAADVEPQAQNIVSKLKNRLNQLYPTKEQQADEVKRNHQYYCEQLSEYSTPIFNPLDIEGSIKRIRFYGLKYGSKLPTPENISVSDFALPSERLKAIAMPPLRAKRIVELINEIDKKTVCSGLPTPLLKTFFATFSDYLRYEDEQDFVSSIHNDMALKPKNGYKIVLLYCFQELAKRLKLNNSLIIEKLAGKSYGNIQEINAINSPLFAEVERFLWQFDIDTKEYNL